MNNDLNVIINENFPEELKKAEIECTNLLQQIKHLEKQLNVVKEKYSTAANKLETLKKLKCNQENKEKIKKISQCLDTEWINHQFEWSEKLKTLLEEKFHFKEFRPKQLAAINATLSKKDVLLVMPTGSGKSLVYQLSSLIDNGFSLIISPLLSLIEDQLIALKKIGIKAAAIHSNISKEEIKDIYKEMHNKKSLLKLLYVTPEWLAKSKRFLANLKKCYENSLIARVAIDEVHCCSMWGHDFRPDYGYLGILRTTLVQVPFIGLTATATMPVLIDIQTMLSLENCMIITESFNRSNLYYEVLPKPSTKLEVLDYLENILKEKYANQSGIIYTTTINDCTNLAIDLKSRGIKVAPYHAQLEPHQKRQIHRKWLENTYQVVVATVAFGMGIDKCDVRFVIHHSIPKSIESLYQESGRAGRDGNNADCIVLFSLNDYFKVVAMASSLIDEKKALLVLEYCLNVQDCRRKLLSEHFEENWDKNCKMCDHCNIDKFHFLNYDITKACRDLHSIISQANTVEEKLTLNKLLDSWFQVGSRKLRNLSLNKPKISKQQAEYVIAFLLLKKFLAIDKGYNTYSTICYIKKGKSLDGENVEMVSLPKYDVFPKRTHAKENDDCNNPPEKKSKKT